jgi:hypothetical protein
MYKSIYYYPSTKPVPLAKVKHQIDITRLKSREKRSSSKLPVEVLYPIFFGFKCILELCPLCTLGWFYKLLIIVVESVDHAYKSTGFPYV